MLNTRLTLLLALLVAAALSLACSSGSDSPTGTALEIAENVFSEASVDPFGPSLALATSDEIEFFLGSTNYPAFADTAVVQPMISLDTRMLYVLKLESDDEAADVIAQLEEDIDPTRLICVTFTHDDVVIDSRGTVVFMTINSNQDERAALVAAFAAID